MKLELRNVLLNMAFHQIHACAHACTYQCETISWAHTHVWQFSVDMFVLIKRVAVQCQGLCMTTNSCFDFQSILEWWHCIQYIKFVCLWETTYSCSIGLIFSLFTYILQKWEVVKLKKISYSKLGHLTPDRFPLSNGFDFSSDGCFSSRM